VLTETNGSINIRRRLPKALKFLHGNEETPYAEFQTGDINIALEPPIVSEPIEALRKQPPEMVVFVYF
jgi:hypothetical protein